nr:uncharacterized protein LOC124813285 [Hydra vulgaris]
MRNCEKYSIKEISNACNLTRNAVGRVIKNSDNNIPFTSSTVKRKETYKIKSSINTNIEQTIFNFVVCNNAVVQKEIQTQILEQHGKNVSISFVSRKLKKLILTRKRLAIIPQERNTMERINQRSIFAAEVARIADSNLVFLDETGFNKHIVRSYGYSPKDTKAYFTVPANKGQNVSLMCLISNLGVECYQYKSGACNTQSFIDFINNKLVLFFAVNPNKILILDNAKFHKAAAVLQLLREKNITNKFLVPYSPELNPIEEFFSMLKSNFKSTRNANPDMTVEETLESILSPDNSYSQQCNAFYTNMRRWLEKAIRREEFI